MGDNGRRVKIRIEDVSKEFRTQNGALQALGRVNLSIYEEEVLTILGKSGCGKSTLLRIVAGITPPSSGQVLMDDKPISGPGADRALVFQTDAVFPWYTVRDNVQYGLKLKGMERTEREKMTDELLSLVGIREYANFWPRQLSGGMRKRVDVARAYAVQPAVLLMDEAFGSLDLFTKEQMQLELQKLLEIRPTTVIFVTHDVEEAILLADRVAIMSPRPGRIEEIYEVPFDKPRDRELKTSPEFQEMRRALSRYFYDNQGAPSHAQDS